MSYDTSCYELAESFLEDVLQPSKTDPPIDDKERIKRHADKLAQEIQDTIEGYIEHNICGQGVLGLEGLSTNEDR